MAYVPKRGDLIWLEFDPQAGREQAGRRPALVISPSMFNAKVGFALVCPITRQVKGYPYEVNVQAGKISGVILTDQIRSLDWRAGKADYIVDAPQSVVQDVIAKLQTLLN